MEGGLAPEWPIGWRVVLATIAVGTLAGSNPAIFLGAGMRPLAMDLALTRDETHFAALFLAASAFVFCPFAGSLVDRFGTRAVAMFAIPAFSLACAGWGLVGTIMGIHFVAMLSAVFAVAISGSVLLVPICKAFATSRGLALGVALGGASVGIGAALLLGNALIEDKGWRQASVILPLTLGAISLLLAVLLMPRRTALVGPKAIPAGINHRAAVLRVLGVVCTYALVTCLFAVLALRQFSLLVDQDFTRAHVAGSIALMSLLAGSGMLAAGYAEDRLGGIGPIMTAYSLALASFVLSLVDLPQVALPVIAVAVGMAAVSSVLVCSRLIPAPRWGLALGTLQSFGAAGSLIGFLLSAGLNDKSIEWSAIAAIPASFFAAGLLFNLVVAIEHKN